MNLIKVFSVMLILVVTSSCSKQLKSSEELDYSMSTIDVIPMPSNVSKAEGEFIIDKNVEFEYDSSLSNSAVFFKEYLKNGLGFSLGEVETDFSFDNMFNSRVIRFSINDSIKDSEAYRITISEKTLLVEAKDDKGAFYAVQTLRQLLPATFENGKYNQQSVSLDLLKIEDAPEYAYRGFMLDVARHFFSVDEVKHVIDLLAIYKINTLHMHLTDDQGWRIEIKSWPNLTVHGSKSSVKNQKAGFYTQEDYIEIQDYASKHCITIIPEVDLPGHTNAALASYAELNCDGKATKLYYGMEVGFSSLCVDKDITYKFIDDVFGELSAITKGEYIHIGGDESHSTKKEDYISFIKKAIDIVKSHNKKVIGWDEIANSDIDPQTIVQYWGRENNAKLGADKGSKIIMSPSKTIYLDIKYNDSTKIGLTWSGLNPVDDAYSWDPCTYIEGVNRENIIGIEAPLWSETVVTISDVEFMTFPRLPGVAEIAWSKQENKTWDAYKLRLAKQKERFEALGINYYKSPLVNWN